MPTATFDAGETVYTFKTKKPLLGFGHHRLTVTAAPFAITATTTDPDPKTGGANITEAHITPSFGIAPSFGAEGEENWRFSKRRGQASSYNFRPDPKTRPDLEEFLKGRITQMKSKGGREGEESVHEELLAFIRDHKRKTGCSGSYRLREGTCTLTINSLFTPEEDSDREKVNDTVVEWDFRLEEPSVK